MCLLVLYYRVAEDAAVVVGANREEFYARGGEPPRLQSGKCSRFVAGTDPQAGGTWLGVNEHGVLVAITNRLKSRIPAQPRSRGLLARELLEFPTADAAAQHATQALDGDQYAGCNFLCADAGAAIVIQAGDWLRVRPLPPGLHAMTNFDVNDASDYRVGHAAFWLGQQPASVASQCLEALRQLCAQHEPSFPPMCFHGQDRGTVSSSLIALRSSLANSVYLHAQGTPDRASYADCSNLLRQLVGSGES
jgi:uncharacterized protein with NRDE domain